MKPLFEYRPGVDRRKEKALRMISEGCTHAEVSLQLRVSHKTLTAWLKAGLPAGDPDLDQVSFVDGLTERERQRQE
jgi:hypothetical protein